MSEKLQQAISATRAGEKREAQQLLAEILDENPNDEYAWFLLGNLVDSPEKRKAYLGKALAINPQNQKAKQQFSQVHREIAAAPTMARSAEMEVEPIDDEELADMPDWLDEQLSDSTSDDDIVEVMDTILDDEEAEVAAVTTAVATPPKSDAQADREKQLRRYNMMLAILVILIILVLIALIAL